MPISLNYSSANSFYIYIFHHNNFVITISNPTISSTLFHKHGQLYFSINIIDLGYKGMHDPILHQKKN